MTEVSGVPDAGAADPANDSLVAGSGGPAPAPGRARQLSDLPDPGAIIFDLDATLVDTLEARIESWLKTFEEIGFPAERKHIAGLIGADGKRLAREVAEVAGRRLSEDRAEAIDRRAGERYDELNTDPRPLPGAVDLLRALERSELPWAIATSSRAEQVTASLQALGVQPGSHVVDGSQVAQAKPAPDLLLHAAERLEVPSHRCWYVGDSTWDMRAAKAANMIGVGVTSGAASADQLLAAGAHVALSSLEPLTADLRRRGLLSDS
jgi:HAD superfamily hydrolase (TIGR01509 family)